MKPQTLRTSKINKNGDELSAGLMEKLVSEQEKDKKLVVAIHAETPLMTKEQDEKAMEDFLDWDTKEWIKCFEAILAGDKK